MSNIQPLRKQYFSFCSGSHVHLTAKNMKSLQGFCSRNRSSNMGFIQCVLYVPGQLREARLLSSTTPIRTVARIWDQLNWQDLSTFLLLNINSQVGKTDHYLGSEQWHIVSERTPFSNYAAEWNRSHTETPCRRSRLELIFICTTLQFNDTLSKLTFRK